MIDRNITPKEQMIATLNAALQNREQPPLTAQEIEAFSDRYDRIVHLLDMYIPKGAADDPDQKVSVSLYDFRDHGGYQIISDPNNVSNTNIKPSGQYNWHLQDTTQWLFACGFVFDTERREFSIHT